MAYRRPSSPPRPKPTRYAAFYDRVRGGLERLTGSTVFALCDGSGRLVSYCPRCRAGVLTAWLSDDPPVLAIPDGCTAGCTETQIAEALFA